MRGCGPKLPPVAPPKTASLSYEGRSYPLILEPGRGWRLRSRSKSHPADYRTGVTNLNEAKRLAKEWLGKQPEGGPQPRKGGGTLEQLARVYLDTPKRTKQKVAEANVSRLRVICRRSLGRELSAVTCREVGPELWQGYQRLAVEAFGHAFDYSTRHRENIAINAAVRAARCLFLPALLRAYRAAGLDVRPDAGAAQMLPVPYVPPSAVDDAGLLEHWRALEDKDRNLWLTIGLARFAGLRREEIAACRFGWLEVSGPSVRIALRDRPEEGWWTKTGKPYRAEVIEPALAEYLSAAKSFELPDTWVVPDPAEDRGRWFERVPQAWLHEHGITAKKPLHRLRGLYADHVAELTRDAVAARLAGLKAAQENLGHTTSRTTEQHYMSPD